MDLVIDPTGRVRALYDETIDLAALGPLWIARASQVEPDAAGCWSADLAPVGGPVLGPFPRRIQEIGEEGAWLAEHWLYARR
jgi:hypothetical protein